ncbi:MAG: hypothetical protein AB7I19_11990 [Planctomycetota bacterium]
MVKKRFSIKGLADFMAANAVKQRKIIRDYKYPDEDEAHAKIIYYRAARDVVTAYHLATKNRLWLDAEAAALRALAEASPGMTRIRLENNARAIEEYAKHFSGRKFEILSDISLELVYGDVTITVRPDIHVRENGTEKIIKLEFSKDEPEKKIRDVISQGMFEAAVAKGMKLGSKQVLYLDVARGKEHKGARLGARLAREIAASCANMSSIWNSI